MTRVFNDPARFKDDVITGFARAFDRYVIRVPDAAGFLRASGPLAGKVSVVVGGGSGHYPSYAGIVGTGFADGCVMGDVFTSPSAEQVYRIGRAADGGAGVVLTFGNYAGDRLNFGIAQERLKSEGIEARCFWVTDDIASAKPEEWEKRRGIAGTFVVYKVAGAAADAGCDLDTVVGLMEKANRRTFSYGVAFAGCTLPGEKEPLFTVEAGQLDIGLGIHGEPGVRSVPMMDADRLAAELVSGLLDERPDDSGDRAAVILNGLGGTKYEELFVLYGAVSRLLEEAGVTAVLPEVGELVTSLDMAGCSLTLTWLDDELERYWTAPADTVSFRRGEAKAPEGFAPVADRAQAATAAEDDESASDASVAAGRVAATAVRTIRTTVEEHEQELGRIDAVAGDGDHGLGMVRGARAADEAASDAEGRGVAGVLSAAGARFGDAAGGTSGVLWGLLLTTVGRSLGNTDDVTPERLREAVREGADAVQRLGKAELGDKTMLDALFPFVEAFEAALASGTPVGRAWTDAAQTATAAAQATADLVPKVGRARPLAERSKGTPDPGAVSMALILTALAPVVSDTPCGDRTVDAAATS